MENANPNTARVQHVTKASSDQLLSKFAEVGSESSAKKEFRLAKRLKSNQIIKRVANGDHSTSSNHSATALVERKSLLPPAASKRSAALIRRLGIGKAKVRARDLRNKSLMGTIEMTWRKTIEGASRVLMEKHYNRHKRLISDMY